MDDKTKEFHKNSLERSAMMTGIFSIIALFIGFSIPFGAMGIILSLLSRGKGELGKNAKIGLALSIFAFIMGLASTAWAYYMMQTNPDYMNIIQQYLNGGDTSTVLTAGVI